MNSNVLEGWKCPKCGATERFEVASKCWAIVVDDGIEESVEHEWSNDSPVRCTACDHGGTVLDFNPPPNLRKPPVLKCLRVWDGDESHNPGAEAELQIGDWKFGVLTTLYDSDAETHETQMDGDYDVPDGANEAARELWFEWVHDTMVGLTDKHIGTVITYVEGGPDLYEYGEAAPVSWRIDWDEFNKQRKSLLDVAAFIDDPEQMPLGFRLWDEGGDPESDDEYKQRKQVSEHLGGVLMILDALRKEAEREGMVPDDNE